jgi:hypothetical protein
MHSAALNSLDSAIATIEGPEVATLNSSGHAVRLDQSPYQPTRDPGEALRLVEKYIYKIQKVNGGWLAVGSNGRACPGATLPIAVCAAIANAHAS